MLITGDAFSSLLGPVGIGRSSIRSGAVSAGGLGKSSMTCFFSSCRDDILLSLAARRRSNRSSCRFCSSFIHNSYSGSSQVSASFHLLPLGDRGGTKTSRLPGSLGGRGERDLDLDRDCERECRLRGDSDSKDSGLSDRLCERDNDTDAGDAVRPLGTGIGSYYQVTSAERMRCSI
jgi:hypothetical protein